MKKSFLFVGLMLACLSVFAQKDMESLSIMSRIPLAQKVYKSVNRPPVSLEKARLENGLLVMFSCNTCPYVLKAQKRTRDMIAYAAEKKIGMVIINSNEASRSKADSREAMANFARKQGYKVPYVIDERAELANAFGATRTPEVFLFNKEGRLVYKGAMEDNPSDPSSSKQLFLKQAMDNMLAGKTIEPISTKSVGCSIKRR